MNIKINKVDRDDKNFPEKLKKISFPPKRLYYIGKLPNSNKKTVAIVGARNASEYGLTLAKTISKILVSNGVQVISGMALGIDTGAHMGAIEAEKPNFAILGTGVDICYPAYNQVVYDKIIDLGGGIISEYDLGTPPLPYNFPQRNRIIAGLCDVLIVVEARDKSGALISADYALEQGKTIFACPGRVGDSLSRGTNNLIKQGAYILTSVDDVLSYLGLICDGFLPKIEIDISKLDYFEKLIYETIGDNTYYIDEISSEAKIPITKCLNVLMSLELNGFIEMTEANCYRKTVRGING